MEVIDLRSDTVTRPCSEMLAMMSNAEVGDDVLGDDPTVKILEEKASSLLGFESALFCPSGTMTNQIAVFLHTSPMEEIIIEESSHIYKFEVGGAAFHSRASLRPIKGIDGKITKEQVAKAINKTDIHTPSSSLVCLENTTNFGGGYFYSKKELEGIYSFTKERGLNVHIDGARLFNGIVASELPAGFFGSVSDSLSICLSKGLGAPVGSLLLGTKDFIDRARKVRKVFGGGMRQAGYLAAAGIFALDNNIDRLATDHKHTLDLYQALKEKPYISHIATPATNILFADFVDESALDQVLAKLESKKIRAIKVEAQKVRFVFHKDVTPEKMRRLLGVL